MDVPNSAALSEEFNEAVTGAHAMCPEEFEACSNASTEVCLLHRSANPVLQREKLFLLLFLFIPTPCHFDGLLPGCLLPDIAVRLRTCRSTR